jgi:hypothetical protein
MRNTMIKNFTSLEHKIGERVYQFYCNPESPLGELHDALHAMRNFIISKMQEIDKKNEEKVPEVNSDDSQ